MAAAHSPRIVAAPLLGAMLLAGMLVSCADAPQGSAGASGPSPETPVSNSARPEVPIKAHDGSSGGPALPADCNAPKAEPFIDRRADATVRADLARAVAPVTAIRWVGPGDATTEDYSPQRLNVMLDVGGMIRSVHCG